MDKLRVEYLVIINTENSFCNSKQAFNNLLSSFDDISINGNKIQHRELQVEYELQSKEIEPNQSRFFHLKLTCNEVSKIDEFTKLLKALRGILTKSANKPPQKIWDDISKFYSLKSYPIIHETENLLRKLITKFMLTNISVDWEKKAVPEEVKKSSRITPMDSNYLYQVDFIQLSNFLFVKYETGEFKEILSRIAKASNISELTLDDLKNSLPNSNWERYFSPIVDCDDGYLEKRWSKLYDLRCKIAHNNEFNKIDFEDTVKLSTEVNSKLEEAINNLDKIKVSTEEKEIIAENIASKTNELYGIYLNKWKYVNLQLFALLKENEERINDNLTSRYNRVDRYRYSVSQMLRLLSRLKCIHPEDLELFTQLNKLRNYMVHEIDVIISDTELNNAIKKLDNTIPFILKNVEEKILEMPIQQKLNFDEAEEE